MFSYLLPSSISSAAANLTAFAGTQPIELTGNGAGRSNLPTLLASLVGLAPSSSGNPVSLAMNLGSGSGLALTTRSTAEALAFLVPGLVTSNLSQASPILTALRALPATAQLQATLDARFAGASPDQVLLTADAATLTTLRTLVSGVLQTQPSPRFELPARALPAVETPTDRGGIQLTTLATRDAQGRLQVTLDNGQPRWVSVVRSYSDDGVTWTTPTAENGTYGVMLGPGTSTGQSFQPRQATIPLSPSPFVRIKTFGPGRELAAVNADPDSRFWLGAIAAQGIASVGVPALEPVLATNTLHTGLTWGTGDQGPMQTWVAAMLPCAQDPAIRAAFQAGVTSGNLNQAFELGYRCGMRAGAETPAVLQGLLTAAGLGGKVAPQSITKMFNVLGTLGTGLEGFNSVAALSVRALNTFDVQDPTRFMSATSVTPNAGPTSGGTTITITGDNFPASPLPTVTVGGVAATGVVRTSATQLTAVTGPRTSAATVDVVVSAAGYRSATCTNCFTYQAAQPVTVTSVSPPFGAVAGGARVSVMGTGFAGITSVTFGGVAGTALQVVSSTRIDVTVPAGAIGAVNVVVTPTSGGAVTCNNCFIYFSPTITVTPSTGTVDGGTQVTVGDIPATSLISGIDLGTRAATALTVLSSTSIRFTTPAGAAQGPIDLNFRYGTLGTLTCPGCFTYSAPAGNLGRFGGVVRSATTNNPIAGAAVSIRTAGTATQVDNVTTAADGSYQSNPIPAGTYDLVYSATGFNNATLFARTLTGGSGTPVTSLPVVQLVPTGTANGNLTGSVRDATSNAVLAGATVEIRSGGGNTAGAALATTTSAADGSYAFNNLAAGTYTVRATRTGYLEGTVNVTIAQATQVAPVLFMSPTGGTAFAWRIVLSWGTTPSDLDAHLTGPLAGSASRFHVFFSTKGSLTASPFAQLDVDVTSGSGPETITIAQQIAGVYRYYVHNFGGTATGLKTSNARVDLYQGNTLVRQFFPPLQDGIYWTVFEISGTDITSINTINNSAPSLLAPSGPLRLRWPEPGDELRELLTPRPIKPGR